jgi:hypothetical protein
MAITKQPPAASANGSAQGASGHPRPSGPPPPAAVYGDLGDGKNQAAALGNVRMPVYVPRVIANQSRYCQNVTCTVGPDHASYPRAYVLHDRRGAPHAAYRMTLVLNPQFGQYYGVEGTTWTNPPILNSPTKTQTVNGKKLMLYINQGTISLAAWRTGGAVYWISNDLTDTLSNQQMLAIAGSLTQVGGSPGPGAGGSAPSGT